MPKPAGTLGSKIKIANWEPRIRKTLRGFFTAIMPSGMVLHHLMLHESGETRWVGLPSREWINSDGVKQHAVLIDFSDRAAADKFRDSVLAALDRHLENLP